MLRTILIISCTALLGACSAILRDPVPAADYLHTSILGRQDLRQWGDTRDGEIHLAFDDANAETLEENFSGIMHREHHYLAISGGGADGAYGAGVLVGWSALGTRPEFTMVTGVSTGALIAPFAYLGPAYDDELKTLYTTMSSTRIFFRRSIFSIIRGDSVTDNKPLRDMINEHITKDMIAEIAREYRKGRILSISTTNLDAGRPVIWNIGRIANSDDPRAADLIRKILLASASIPGIFPPAYIQVQTRNGKTYDEMHVDGGTSAQMFLYPSRTNFSEVRELLDIKGTPRAYVIRNSRIYSSYKPVKARLPDIAGRSVSSLIRTQGIGDAYRIAATSHRDGVELDLTWIPSEAPVDRGKEVFDPEYMSALFDYGYQRAISGTAWMQVDLSQIQPVQQNQGQ